MSSRPFVVLGVRLSADFKPLCQIFHLFSVNDGSLFPTESFVSAPDDVRGQFEYCIVFLKRKGTPVLFAYSYLSISLHLVSLGSASDWWQRHEASAIKMGILNTTAYVFG
jgi:hypothetical protein